MTASLFEACALVFLGVVTASVCAYFYFLIVSFRIQRSESLFLLSKLAPTLEDKEDCLFISQAHRYKKWFGGRAKEISLFCHFSGLRLWILYKEGMRLSGAGELSGFNTLKDLFYKKALPHRGLVTIFNKSLRDKDFSSAQEILAEMRRLSHKDLKKFESELLLVMAGRPSLSLEKKAFLLEKALSFSQENPVLYGELAKIYSDLGQEENLKALLENSWVDGHGLVLIPHLKVTVRADSSVRRLEYFKNNILPLQTSFREDILLALGFLGLDAGVSEDVEKAACALYGKKDLWALYLEARLCQIRRPVGILAKIEKMIPKLDSDLMKALVFFDEETVRSPVDKRKVSQKI